MNNNTLFTALLLGSGLLWQSCGGNDSAKSAAGAAQGPTAATAVSTAVAQQEIVNAIKRFPATVIPLQETELRAEVSGYITQINIADGATVSKGQVLFEIDRVRYQAAVNQAQANVEIAKSNLQRVQKDVERYQLLDAKDAIAKQTLDYAFTDLSNQKASVQAAEANLLTAKTNLSRSVIRAPFSGTVGFSQVRLGALVSAGTTILNTLSSTNPIAIEFQISEKEIGEFTSLQTKQSNAEISAILPDGTTYPSSGRIVTIDRAVDSKTGTLKVRAAFDNASNNLRAGMNLTLNVTSNTSNAQLVIPYKAIFEQLGTFNVYTVNDSSIAVIKQVEIGDKADQSIVIKSGIQEGDKVIIDGIMNVKNGSPVSEVQPVPAADSKN